jgi:hypothetical protein
MFVMDLGVFMKTKIKLTGIVAAITVIMFFLVGCDPLADAE